MVSSTSSSLLSIAKHEPCASAGKNTVNKPNGSVAVAFVHSYDLTDLLKYAMDIASGAWGWCLCMQASEP